MISSLTASYIGGTANYFEVAHLLSKLGITPDIMNAIDIGVMVIFFAVLNIIRGNSVCVNLLPRKKWIPKKPSINRLYVEPTASDPIFWRHQMVKVLRILKLIMAALFVTTCVLVFSSLLPFRGVSVMLTSSIGIYLNSLKPMEKNALFEELEVLSSIGSLFLVCMFYSIVGLSSGLGEFASVGTTLLLLITSILTIHLFVLLIGSKLFNMILAKFGGGGNNMSQQMPFIDIDSAIVASNAAIGGPATAASYASMIGRPDLVVSASLAGILGYLIGSPLGLYLSRLFIGKAV